ncbi:hypothetical protein ISCGN_031930 [Ixodes scapularis]
MPEAGKNGTIVLKGLSGYMVQLLSQGLGFNFSPAAALSVDGNLEEMDTRPASQASPAAAATDQLTTSLIAPAKRTAEEKPFLGESSTTTNNVDSAEIALKALFAAIPRERLIDIFKNFLEESSPNKPSKGKKKKSDKTNPPTANSSPNSASIAMPEATTPAQETPITAASRRQDADTTALMIFTAGCAQDGAAATEWQGPLPSDDEKWTPVTYKRRKRVRVDPSLQAHGAVRPRQRLFEYKVRPTNSQVSIKPYLQPLKTQCTMLRTTASFSMHLIEQANTISVRTDTEELAKMLSEITEIKVQGREALPVQVFRTFGTSYTKGIIYDIYPKEQDPRDEVLNHELESEKVDIVAARRLGKSNTAVITFDGERLPRSIFYGKRYMRVFPHKPKAVTCRNCHRLGHKPDICPNQAVCPTCGTSHLADTDPAKGPGCPDSTPYCQGCKKKGHLGTDRKCPTWSATNKRMREDIQKLKKQHRLQQPSENTERVKNTTKTQSGTSWADKVKQNIQAPPPAPTGGSTIHVPSDGNWGGRRPDGSWGGQVCNVAAGPMAMNADRVGAMQPLPAFYYADGVHMAGRRQMYSTDVFGYIYAFDEQCVHGDSFVVIFPLALKEEEVKVLLSKQRVGGRAGDPESWTLSD